MKKYFENSTHIIDYAYIALNPLKSYDPTITAPILIAVLTDTHNLLVIKLSQTTNTILYKYPLNATSYSVYLDETGSKLLVLMEYDDICIFDISSLINNE